MPYGFLQTADELAGFIEESGIEGVAISLDCLHLSCNAILSPEDADARADAETAAWLACEAGWWEEGGGHEHIQQTRSRTLAVALNDSPLGAAAWMIEKWSAWADGAEDPIARFGADELLTHVMLHWCAASVGTSVLTYTAARDRAGMRPRAGAVTAPAGFYLSEPEPHGIPPRSFAERQYESRAGACCHAAAISCPPRNRNCTQTICASSSVH